MMCDCIKCHNYQTMNQIANICCYSFEACLEDEKFLVALVQHPSLHLRNNKDIKMINYHFKYFVFSYFNNYIL